MLIGNPGQPALQTNGILYAPPTWWSFRIDYLDDFVYREQVHDEFLIAGTPSNTSWIKLSTYAAQVTLNFKNRIDLYGLLGSSRIRVDNEIYSKRRFAWGIGTKFIIFQEGNFHFGADFKYFETDQKPTFFNVDGSAYNIIGDYRLKYHEVQAAVGCTYLAWIFAPYINATYLVSKLEPHPHITLVRLPDENIAVDVTSDSQLGAKRWGMAIGLTLLDQAKATLAVEWRLFNQNAIDINAELRF